MGCPARGGARHVFYWGSDGIDWVARLICKSDKGGCGLVALTRPLPADWGRR